MANYKCEKCGYVFWFSDHVHQPPTPFVCDRCAKDISLKEFREPIREGCMYFGKTDTGRLIKMVAVESTPSEAVLMFSLKTENKWKNYILIRNYKVDGDQLVWKEEERFYSGLQAIRTLRQGAGYDKEEKEEKGN